MVMAAANAMAPAGADATPGNATRGTFPAFSNAAYHRFKQEQNSGNLMRTLTLCCLLAIIATAAAQPALPCGGTVTNVALSVDNRVPNAPANVAISFTTQSALAPYNTVTLNYPLGFFVAGPTGYTNPATVGIVQATPGASTGTLVTHCTRPPP